MQTHKHGPDLLTWRNGTSSSSPILYSRGYNFVLFLKIKYTLFCLWLRETVYNNRIPNLSHITACFNMEKRTAKTCLAHFQLLNQTNHPICEVIIIFPFFFHCRLLVTHCRTITVVMVNVVLCSLHEPLFLLFIVLLLYAGGLHGLTSVFAACHAQLCKVLYACLNSPGMAFEPCLWTTCSLTDVNRWPWTALVMK